MALHGGNLVEQGSLLESAGSNLCFHRLDLLTHVEEKETRKSDLTQHVIEARHFYKVYSSVWLSITV